MSEPKPKKSKEGKGRHVNTDCLTYPSNVADDKTPICLPTKMEERPTLRSLPERAVRTMEYREHPCRIIARYNFKGGVGKTTSTFSLGYKFAATGKRVMMVDADAQCNLTQLVLRRTVSIVTDNEDYDAYFDCTFQDPSLGRDPVGFDHPHTIAQALSSVLAGSSLTPAQLVRVGGQKNLFLLPGDARLQSIETKLARSLEDRGFKEKLGIFYHMILMTAHKHNVDVVLIDLPPSMGAITRIAMMSSDYLMIPYTPDYFSCQAVRLLTNILCAGEDDKDDTGDCLENNLSPPQESALQVANDTLSTEMKTNWLEWLREKQRDRAGADFPLPVMRVCRGELGRQRYRGPRLLGGQLTRFVECKNAGKRKLIINAQHWQGQIRDALAELNQRLPAELRMPTRPDGSIECYWREDISGASEIFKEWHQEFGLTIGRAAEYYQLSSISQRESLPVLGLKEKHIKKAVKKSDDNTYVFKELKKEERVNALKRVETDNQDYADMAKRIQALFRYFDAQERRLQRQEREERRRQELN